MSIMTVFSQMLSLFFIMAVGFVIQKANILPDNAAAVLTKVVLNVSLPAQIISSFLSNQGLLSGFMLLEVFGISALCLTVQLAMAEVFVILFRVPEEERGLYCFMLEFGNVGFMGYPVVQAIFGDTGMIYAVIYNVLFNFVVYSLGIAMIGGKKAGKFNFRKLLNMPMISAAAAVCLFFTPVRLPDFLSVSLDYMGNLTTPLAMLILGITIAQMPVRELFQEWRVYVFTFWKLLLLPAGIFLALRFLGLQEEILFGTMVIISAMPVATTATMLTIEYHGDVRLASRGIFFSTVLSVATIPLIALLTQ